jgi:hypothetical protein
VCDHVTSRLRRLKTCKWVVNASRIIIIQINFKEMVLEFDYINDLESPF